MNRLKQQGFTLAETLVVIFVIGFIVVALLTLYSLHSNVYSYQQALIQASSTARDSMADIGNLTTQSSYVMNNQVFDGVTYNTGTTTLILQLPALDNSGNALGNTWDYAVFYLNGSSLYEKVAPDPVSTRPARYRQLSDSVSNLAFIFNISNNNYVNASSVTVDLLNRKVIKGQNIDVHLNQQWFLRNYPL